MIESEFDTEKEFDTLILDFEYPINFEDGGCRRFDHRSLGVIRSD